MHLDVTVLLAGTALLVVLLAALTWISAFRAVATLSRDRPAPVPSSSLERAVRWLGPAAGTGVRFAFSAPRDRPGRVRPALVGATVAVVGLVAVGVVASGIDRLLASPARWGTTWDVSVSVDAADRQAVLADQDIAAAAVGTFDDRVAVKGHGTLAMVLDPLKGSVLPSLVAGREPRADDEVAMGRDTLHAAGASVGDIVDVRSATERGQFRVVGVAAFPPIDSGLPLADGAAFSPRGAERLKIGDPAREDAGFQGLLIRWASGVDPRAALARLGGEEIDAGLPVAPNEVARLDEVRGFPAAIAATLVVLGAIAVTYTLGATVRRRRGELGILSALGLVPTQRRTVITTQATTLAVAALVVGIPIGLVAGRLVWWSIAESMGVATDASQPLRQIAIGVVLLVATFNVIAVVPA